MPGIVGMVDVPVISHVRRLAQMSDMAVVADVLKMPQRPGMAELPAIGGFARVMQVAHMQEVAGVLHVRQWPGVPRWACWLVT